ncbi:MAG: serine hydrolase domain-containing protein [Bryobacteraceae bacterium]|nr:serine hydrolase domain-containing protein [Bryobacteraceae bacterium]
MNLLFLGLLAAEAVAPKMPLDRTAKISQRMQAFVDEGKVAGLVTLVMHNGQVIHHHAAGVLDVETKKPMAKDSIFQIMSMTKPFVSVAILMMAEEGKLTLMDPVERHLPEFKGQKGGSRPITIRDLLTHTSGLGTQPPKPIADLYAKGDLTLEEAVKYYAKTFLDFEPGTKWQYSNMGIDTLGRIVEVTSGMAFEKFLHVRILGPLGMKDSFIFPPAEKHPRIAMVHEFKSGKLQRSGPVFYGGDPSKYRTGSKFSMPAAGLYSTAPDLAKFYQTMLNGGTYMGKRLLSRASVETMTTLHTGDIKAGHNPGTGFGLAWEVQKEAAGTLNLMSVGTFGHGGAFGTHGWVDPKKKLVGVFLVQSTGGGDAAFIKQAFIAMASSVVPE